MTTLSESRADIHVAEAIVGLKNLILDPDEVRNGTKAHIPEFAKTEGEVITLKWLGGAGHDFIGTFTVNADNIKDPIFFLIAYTPYIIGNLDTSVTVFYEVRRTNGRVDTSPALTFRIQRQLEQNLVAPTVIEASLGGTLDPINAQNGATVRVAYAGMLLTDSLAAVWTIEGNPNAYETAAQNGSLSGFVNFLIPVAVVAASQGKRISVRYFVGRGGRPGVPSALLELSVSVLGQEHLPAPVVPQASGGTLDFYTFQSNAMVNVQPWPLIAAGQRYWIKVSGMLESGVSHMFYPAKAIQVNESQVGAGLSVVLLRTELEKLKDLSELTVEVRVAFDGAANENLAQVFPVLALTFKIHRIVSGSENWESVPLQTFELGRPVRFPSGVTVEVITDASSPGLRNSIHEYRDIKGLLIVTSSRVDLTFGGHIRFFSAILKGNDFAGVVVKYYDGRDLVDSRVLPNSPLTIPFQFTAPSGRGINRVEFEASRHDEYYIDDLVWR